MKKKKELSKTFPGLLNDAIHMKRTAPADTESMCNSAKKTAERATNGNLVGAIQGFGETWEKAVICLAKTRK
jgi:hypothetical protein